MPKARIKRCEKINKMKVTQRILSVIFTKLSNKNLIQTYISHKNLTSCFGPSTSVRHASTHVSRYSAPIAAKATVHVHSRHAETVKARAHSVHPHVTHAPTWKIHTRWNAVYGFTDTNTLTIKNHQSADKVCSWTVVSPRNIGHSNGINT